MEIPKSGNPITNILEIRKKGLLHFLLEKAQQHNDIFRITLGPIPFIVVIHPDAIRQILVTDHDSYTKGKSLNTVRKVLIGNGIVTSVDEDWFAQRRLLSPFFTPRMVGQFATMMIDEVTNMLDRWHQLGTSRPINMNDEMGNLTARIILKTLFSTLNEHQLEHLKGDVDTMVDYSMLRAYTPIKLPMWVPTRHIQNYKVARTRIASYIQIVIDERRRVDRTGWPNDFLTALLDGEINGNPLTSQEVFDQALTFFVAGQETAARTLGFALYALSQYPKIEQKLCDEIDQIVGRGKPTLDQLSSMNYVIKVIKETMRLYPAVAFYVRDVKRDTLLHGYPVAAGDRIFLFPYATHRMPEFWDNPEQFDPERFEPEQEKARHPQAYSPFSAGPRICMGNHFALLEMEILLVMVYMHFKLRLIDGHDPQIDAPSLLAATNGLPMYLYQRTEIS